MATRAQAAAAKRFLRGHALAEKRQHQLVAARGPQPKLAIAESLAAINAADELGLWPAPRTANELREISQVRRRWAKIQQHAKKARARTR